jgi:alkylation response protein AidB-like acyl-CoA dehydrogenase
MATAYRDIGRSLETDPFRLDDELTDAERADWRTARDFVDDTALPVISGYQDKLVRMLADLTAMQLYCLRLGRLIERRRLDPRDGCAGQAQQHPAGPRADRHRARVVGGNGLLLDHHVMRHMADFEAVYTYDGTAEIETLLVGRDLTGISAFA